MKSTLILTGTLMLAAAAAAHADPAERHVRVLAASCAACHGPGGNSVGGTPVLAGLERGYFVAQMQGFRSGNISATVMHRHAAGLTASEIEQLADHFAAQPRQSPALPGQGGE